MSDLTREPRVAWRYLGRFANTLQLVAPCLGGCFFVLSCNPLEIFPIRNNLLQPSRIALLAIDRHQFPQEKGCRTAIHHQMVRRYNELVLSGSQTNQGESPERRDDQVKAPRPVRIQHLSQPMRAFLLLKGRYIETLPWQPSFPHNHLNRAAQTLLLKNSPEVPVTMKDQSHCLLQPHFIHVAYQIEHHPPVISVRRLFVIERMEEQSLLQRRQWQHLFQLRMPAFQHLLLSLAQRKERLILRLVARTRCGVPQVRCLSSGNRECLHSLALEYIANGNDQPFFPRTAH